MEASASAWLRLGLLDSWVYKQLHSLRVLLFLDYSRMPLHRHLLILSITPLIARTLSPDELMAAWSGISLCNLEDLRSSGGKDNFRGRLRYVAYSAMIVVSFMSFLISHG